MRAYFLTIAGAAVLSSLAAVISPERWRGYVRLVTGIVIISCIISPLAELSGKGGSFKIPERFPSGDYDGQMYERLVKEELERRVEEDIEARVMKEYGADITAEVTVSVNGEGGIEGVERITVSGGELSGAAKRRLCDIYGVDTVYEK